MRLRLPLLGHCVTMLSVASPGTRWNYTGELHFASSYRAEQNIPRTPRLPRLGMFTCKIALFNSCCSDSSGTYFGCLKNLNFKKNFPETRV